MDFYSKAAMERAMKIQEVLWRRWRGKSHGFKRPRFWVLAIGIRGAFESGTRSLRRAGSGLPDPAPNYGAPTASPDGESAAVPLLERIGDGQVRPRKNLVEPELIVRESTAKPGSDRGH